MPQGGAAAATVDVWLLDPLDLEPARLQHLLDAAEHARAAALPDPASRRFVLARALLRGVLGAHLGQPAAEVVLRATCPRCGGPHGQVLVEPVRRGGSAPQVSLSRSGPLIAVALCRSAPVGVDVESRTAVAGARLADVVLSPEDHARHLLAPPIARASHLAHSWVRTEAAFKALGTGLRADPAALDLRDDRAVLVRDSGGMPAGSGAVLADLPTGGDAVGAVAVLLPASRRDFPSLDIRLAVHDGEPVVRALLSG